MTDQCIGPTSFSRAVSCEKTLRIGERAANVNLPLFDLTRLRLYPLTAFFLYLIAAFLSLLWSHDGLNLNDIPLGYDFITFWGASLLSLQGHAESAFQPILILDAERAAIPANNLFYLWHYPPTFQLMILPLALLPYGVAWISFVGTSAVAYVSALYPLQKIHGASRWTKIFLILGFPGTFLAVAHGQNSMLSAALLAGSALLIKTRPIFAGILLGLFAFKPQLALLIPLALIAGRQWRTFFAAGITAVVFCLVAALVFGFGLWEVFFKNTALVRSLLENAWLPWGKIPNAYVFFRMLGVPSIFAYGAQAAAAIIAALTVVLVWRRTGPTKLAFAVLITANLFSLPYLFDYEFTLLAVPLAIVASDIDLHGAPRFEKAALVGLYIMPLFAAAFAKHFHLQIGFLALVLCLILCVKRAINDTGTISRGQSRTSNLEILLLSAEIDQAKMSPKPS